MEVFQLTDEEAKAIEAVRAWADGGISTSMVIDNRAIQALQRRDMILPEKLDRWIARSSMFNDDKYIVDNRDAARAFIEAWDAVPITPPEDDAIATARRFVQGGADHITVRQTRAFVAAMLAEVVRRDESGLPAGLDIIMARASEESFLVLADECNHVAAVLSWYDAPAREEALAAARRELDAAKVNYNEASAAHESAVDALNAATRNWSAATTRWHGAYDVMIEKRAEVARLENEEK